MRNMYYMKTEVSNFELNLLFQKLIDDTINNFDFETALQMSKIVHLQKDIFYDEDEGPSEYETVDEMKREVRSIFDALLKSYLNDEPEVRKEKNYTLFGLGFQCSIYELSDGLIDRTLKLHPCVEIEFIPLRADSYEHIRKEYFQNNKKSK